MPNNGEGELIIDSKGTVKNIPIEKFNTSTTLTPVEQNAIDDIMPPQEGNNPQIEVQTFPTESVVTPDGKRIYANTSAHDWESGQDMETQNSKEAPETDSIMVVRNNPDLHQKALDSNMKANEGFKVPNFPNDKMTEALGNMDEISKKLRAEQKNEMSKTVLWRK